MSVVAVVGLGYVGLPLAVEFGKKMTTIGYDLSVEKIEHYRRYCDPTGEVSTDDLRSATRLTVTTDPADLAKADFIIVAVPTPVDQAHNDYHVDISIPAGSIQTRPDETDIVYKMTASVTFKNTLGRPGPIAGFVELPMVQWYKDV